MGRTRRVDTPSKGLGADLAKAFNKPPEAGSGADFIVTALSADLNEENLLGSALIRATNVADGNQTWLLPDSRRDLANIAGLLVMSNIYNIPHLRLLQPAES